jgi:hypothetical protein
MFGYSYFLIGAENCVVSIVLAWQVLNHNRSVTSRYHTILDVGQSRGLSIFGIGEEYQSVCSYQ